MKFAKDHPSQNPPPVDNDHVAPGCEPFHSPPTPPVRAEGGEAAGTPRRYPNHPCHWWPNLTTDDATEDEIELVIKIAGDSSTILGMTAEQWRRNLRVCARDIRAMQQASLTAARAEVAGLREENLRAREMERELAALRARCIAFEAVNSDLRAQLMDRAEVETPRIVATHDAPNQQMRREPVSMTATAPTKGEGTK